MKNAINWFELPVADMNRAVGFYEELLADQLSRSEMAVGEIALLPHEGGVGGEVLLPKTSVGEHGFCAWLRDSEGNRVGLHSLA